LEVLADAWQRELTARWQEMAQAPRDLALPAAIVAAPVGWQRIVGKFASERGTAVRLMNAKGEFALLFVMRMTAPDAPHAPPPVPQSTTEGKAVGYWQAGKLVYVLVVDPGTTASYRTFVAGSSTPLAMLTQPLPAPRKAA
jgi:hypothetical protein